jgi:hypothetical protein
MFKFVSELPQGNFYGFGLPESDLNRMEFNRESLFFDFGYARRPDLFGLILFIPEFYYPSEITQNIDLVKRSCLPFLDQARGVIPDTLRVFPIAKSVMAKFRESPYWGLQTQIEIAHPEDKQVFFSGPDEQAIENYLRQSGAITPQTKRTFRGFGLPPQ